MAKVLKNKMHFVFLLIVIVIASSIIFAYPRCNENMSNMDNGASLGWSMGSGLSGESWENRADQYASSMGYTDSTKAYSSYEGTPIPLPEGQLDFFANNQFKPECCESSNYSSGSGCACISAAQMNYLNQRGGNRTIGPENF